MFYWYSLVHSKQEAVRSMGHVLDPFRVKQTVQWIDISKQKMYVSIVYMTFNVMLLINCKARIKCSFWFLVQLYLVVYLILSCYLICDFVIFFDILVLLKACLSMKRKVLSNNLSLTVPKMGIVAHVCNPSTQDSEESRSLWVQGQADLHRRSPGQPGLHSEIVLKKIFF